MIKRIFLLVSIFIVIYISLTIIFTESHENAHLEIDKIYGCSGSDVKYGFLHLSGKEYSLGCPLSTELDRNRLHAINDIFGYNIKLIYLSILFVGLLITISLLVCNKK